MNFAVLIAVPLFILIRFCIYRSAVTAIVKQDKQMHRGKPVKVQNFVTEESIKSIVMKDGVNEIRYSQIKKVVHTKTIIILFSDVNLMYVFDKDTFTKGTAQEFISFLKGKGIKVAYVR